MINWFWQWLARFISKHPSIIEWIIGNAQNKPYFHLDGYMDRWWLTPKWLIGKDRHGNPYPYNWVPMILKARLHYIKRADMDRHMHDHPADNRSIVLIGYYDEQDVFGRSNIRMSGDTVLRRAETFHKIAYVPSSGVWTLWFLNEKRNEWGFLVDGRKIHYETYFKMQKEGLI